MARFKDFCFLCQWLCQSAQSMGHGVLRFKAQSFTAIGASKVIFTADTATLTASVSFVDRLGHPAKVDGIPAWQMTGDPIGDLAASADGLGATITLNGSLGSAQVAVTADADLSEGVRQLIVTGDLQIVAAEAVSGSVTFAAA